MNIFYTNEDPILCAKEHCKVHVVKMIIEYSQLLSTAHHVLDRGRVPDNICARTHENHPCAIWVRESASNYRFLHLMLDHLLDIYSAYSGKENKLSETVRILSFSPINIDMTATFTCPPQCMPEEFKQENTCLAYQNYVSSKFKDWTTRTDKKRMPVEFISQKPEWWSANNGNS